MNVLFDDYAVRFLVVVLYLFLSLFVYLIGFVLVHRYLLNRWEGKLEQSQERLLPYLYAYIDGGLKRKEFADLLDSRFDISASFRNIRLMIDNLEGKQKTRLKSLLDIPDFKKFYLKNLRSRKTIDIAQACIYFEKKNITDKSVIRRLMELQTHSYSVIGYSSTLALINTTDQQIRDDALDIFLHRRNNSSMAVSDIIFEYYNTHPDKEKAGSVLFSKISDPLVPADSAVPIVQLLPEFGLYDLANDLFELFKAPFVQDKTGRLTAAIIEVLDEFSTEDITPLIQEKRLWSSRYQRVRLATAAWMQRNYRPVFDDQLIILASDRDLEVRVAAQKALLQTADVRRFERVLNPSHLKEWNEIKRAETAYVTLG